MKIVGLIELLGWMLHQRIETFIWIPAITGQLLDLQSYNKNATENLK